MLPIEVVYAKESLGTDDRGFGLLLGAWGVGIFLGSLVFARSKRPTLLLLGVSTAAVGVSYLGMAIAGNLGVACALALLGGIGNGVQWVSIVTAVQEATPADMQARIVGAAGVGGRGDAGRGLHPRRRGGRPGRPAGVVRRGRMRGAGDPAGGRVHGPTRPENQG